MLPPLEGGCTGEYADTRGTARIRELAAANILEATVQQRTERADRHKSRPALERFQYKPQDLVDVWFEPTKIQEVGEVVQLFSPSKPTRGTLLYDFKGGPLTEPQLKFASTFHILLWVLTLWRNISVTSVHYDSIVATLRQIHYVFMDWYSLMGGI